MTDRPRPPLPTWPARVRVTLRTGQTRWLADPPENPGAVGGRWHLVDEVEQAGVWPWGEAVALEREVRQPWRQQYATAVRVEEET